MGSFLSLYGNKIGGSSGSDGGGGIKYDPETDMIYLWNGTQWVEWKVAGLVSTDFIDTVASDWQIYDQYTNRGSVSYPSAGTIRFENNADGISYNDTISNMTYLNKVGISAGKKLKVVGTFKNGQNSATSYLYIQASTDNFVSDSTNLISKSVSTTGGTVSINETIDLSNYAGEEISIRVYLRTGWSINITFDATKFIIE